MNRGGLDYFLNCLRKVHAEADFVTQAVDNRFRYFRLEQDDEHAMLQLERTSPETPWTVRQLHGLANKDVNATLKSVADRVAQVYTLLESNTALVAKPLKDEGGTRE